MKIALDVESVLANTNAAVLQSTDKISRSELLGEWDLSDEMWQVYCGVSDSVWRHNPSSIPAQEPSIDQYVSEMSDKATVDIVTARPHVDENIVWWLEDNNIQYNEFYSVDCPKYELDYDMWVDDNPEMFGECRLLLRHHPWNKHCDDELSQSCDRIYSLAEVSDFL